MKAANQPSSRQEPDWPHAMPFGRGLSRLTTAPGRHDWKKLLGRSVPDILSAASDKWEIAPSGVMDVRPALMLPGQLNRIRGAEFGTIAEVTADFTGGHAAMQPPTIGYRIRNVTLIDGVFYAGDAARHLRRRTNRVPVALVPDERLSVASYESWVGNRWFGNWLCDDCLTHGLAQLYGTTFTSSQLKGHMGDYETALGMRPIRRTMTSFEELILFDDQSHNDDKRRRATELRQRLTGDGLDGRTVKRHPGIFLLRGHSGDARVLVNEMQIAERLAARRGFMILDPNSASVEEIVGACGGAMVVAGVEGSQLVHGLMVMPEDARAFVIQPPDRAVSALKRLTDRQGQNYSLLVGEGTHEAFSVDGDEVERTLDLV